MSGDNCVFNDNCSFVTNSLVAIGREIEYVGINDYSLSLHLHSLLG